MGIVKKRKSSDIEMKEEGLEETKVEDESKTQPLEVDDQKKEKDMEQEEDKELKVSPKKKKKKEIRDPGWDFSATCITAPSWKRSSIWSEDELEDDDASEETEKSHVSKAEAKRRKRVEEEQAAAREQRILDGEQGTPDSVEEFERLVVSSPDASLVWVQYMALVMESGELETARGIA